MTERVQDFLSHKSVRDALQAEDVVDLLSEVASLSDFYIPVLQFLIRPDNLTALIACLVEEVAPPPGPRVPSDYPSYDEYALVYRAHWLLCASNFSSQLISALIALQDNDRIAVCELLVACDSRDAMNLEALARFLNVFMDQYSPDALLAFIGPELEAEFVETLLVLIFYEPIRDVLLRIYTELPESRATLHRTLAQVMYQLAPDRAEHFTPLPTPLRARMQRDQQHHQFSRMIFTCDLFTDLIHERRTGSLGYWLITEIVSKRELAVQLINAAADDLRQLPSSFANESFVVKVLNSLLQQAQCGCVAKVAFGGAGPVSPTAVDVDPDGASVANGDCGSPHEELPVLWKCFIEKVPQFLRVLHFPLTQHFKTTHVQMIYLMLPILNASCSQVDRHLIDLQAMETLLQLIVRFPESNILHCAISRLFIVALEDSPFMFGKELPAFRASNDPLRMHLLLHGCFRSVLDVFQTAQQRTAAATAAGSTAPRRKFAPPPAFLDIAISFDQAVTNAQAHSPHLFDADMLDQWQQFRVQVLLPTQTQWEEQYEAAAAAVQSASPVKGNITGEGYDELMMAQMQQEIREANGTANGPPVAAADAVVAAKDDGAATVVAVVPLPVPVDDGHGPQVEDVPTPLSALYNEEEKNLMLKVAATGSPSPTKTDSSTVAS